MYWIAHRGNLYGPNPDHENSPDYILKALLKGFDVEIDVWFIEEDGTWWLGHDKPQYIVSLDFLRAPRLWIHAKSFRTLIEVLKYKELHVFSHENDPVVLTSRAIPWVYPGYKISAESIAVMPETVPLAYTSQELSTCGGICSDYIVEYFKRLRAK